jgi:hypothetical protein
MPAIDPSAAAIEAAPRSRRDTALDALRMIAVLLMVASHTSRLIAWDERREWSRFSLLIEPLTASLFLILVGASLTHSWRSSRERGRLPWYRKQATRAAALWAVSCVFYTLEDGFRLPDAMTMSGILATIAYSILSVMLLVSAPRPVPALMAVSAALICAHAWLDFRGAKVFVLNAGNSPLLPLSLFACLGALGAQALEIRNRFVKAALVTAALLTLAFVLQRHSFTEVFSKPIGRFETSRTLTWMKGDVAMEKNVPYYNLKPILVPVISSLIVLLYAALAMLRPLLDRSSRFLLPLGRRSLDVYILHLFLLAMLVLRGGKRPLRETWQGDAVFLAVLAICYGWVLLRDRFPLRRRARRA